MVKKKFVKKWRSLQKSCPRFSENAPISFCLFKNALNPKNNPFLVKKIVKSLHKYCFAATWKAFSLKFILDDKVRNCVIERYHIQVFFPAELPKISIWKRNRTFQILKTSKKVKSKSLGQAGNKSLFLQTVWNFSFSLPLFKNALKP